MRIVDKPAKWDNRSLALATKEELIADILIRRQLIDRFERSQKYLAQMTVTKQKQWLRVLKKELESRYVIEIRQEVG